MSEGTFTFEIDWDNDGLFTGTGEDVSARARARSPFTASHGRRQNRRLSPPAASRARFALVNTSGDYYPDNGASPLSGNVAPGRIVHVGVNFDSTDYDLFSGQLFGLDFQADPFGPFVNIECLDVVNTLNRSQVAVDALEGQSLDACIGAVLDAVGWPSGDRDLDNSPVTLPVWWAEGEKSAWEEILMLLEVEGPPSICYVGPDGNFVFKSRHHRLVDARATSSQNTFRGTGTEPTYQRFTFDPGWRDIINRVEIPVTPTSGAGRKDVHESTESILVNFVAGTETVNFTTTTPFPAESAVWDPNISVNNTGLEDPLTEVDTTFSGTFPNYTLEITLNVTGFIITSDWRVNAVPYNTTPTFTVTDEDLTSQGEYGIRTWRARSPWFTSESQAEVVAAQIINDRKDPRTIATIEVNNGNDTRYTAGLDTQISDLLTIDDAESSVNGTFHIENIAHTVTSGGKFHTVTLGLESAATPIVAAADVFILDSLTNGELDVDRLGL